MTLSDVINENTIALDLQANTKKEAIRSLTGLLVNDNRVSDAARFETHVFEREAIESTDMGVGIAIPHGKSDTVLQPSVAIGRLAHPFYWQEGNNEEKQPIFAIFMLAVSNQDSNSIHLELLSKIATLLLEDDFVHLLRTTTNPTELFAAIQTHIGEA